MQIIPLSALSNQIFNITINGAGWRIAVYEKKGYDDNWICAPRIFVDLYLSSTLLVGGALASIGVPLLRHGYLTPGSTQDFFFVDTKGDLSPQTSGLGTRWLLTTFNSEEQI